MKTETLKIDPVSPDEKIIKFAATLLRGGGLVAFPTETVYGIGANLLDEKAIDRLYEVKKRPRSKPLTVHISSVDTVCEMGCEISPLADELIKNFWPGPLTIILKLKPFPTCQVGNGKLGFRMPKNAVAKALIAEAGVPVVAPSANISGEKPPTSADAVFNALDGKIDLILDSGSTEFGRESTVVDTTVFPYKILRKGAVSEEEIARAWKKTA